MSGPSPSPSHRRCGVNDFLLAEPTYASLIGLDRTAGSLSQLRTSYSVERPRGRQRLNRRHGTVSSRLSVDDCVILTSLHHLA